MKKKRLVQIFLCCVLLAGCGSRGKNNKTSEEIDNGRYTINELCEDANSLDNTYESIDLSETKIYIPQASKMHAMTFPLDNKKFDDVKEKFISNIKTMSDIGDVNAADLNLLVVREDDDYTRELIPINEVCDEDKFVRNATFLYNDGSCSQILYETSYICELSNYSIPVSLTGDREDHSEDIWGYRAFDLGSSEKVYKLPDDDIKGVSYMLSDGEMLLTEAVDFVEKHIKEDYVFVGSELLDYKVCEIDVRKINEKQYYYQFVVRAFYDGAALNMDYAFETLYSDTEQDPLLMRFGDCHRASMFRSGNIDYVWSSAHSYDEVIVEESYDTFISLEEACRLADSCLSNKTKIKIRSIELLYNTYFQYDSVESINSGEVKAVKCIPVFHFVGDPTVLGYARIYIDVDAQTGDVLITKQ